MPWVLNGQSAYLSEFHGLINSGSAVQLSFVLWLPKHIHANVEMWVSWMGTTSLISFTTYGPGAVFEVLMTIGEMLISLGFNVEDYDSIADRLRKSKVRAELYFEITGGLSAAASRFIRSAETSDAFTKSITEDGDAPPFPARYLQDQSLFDFFINGHSAIESFSYCLHALAALLDDTGVLSMEEKNIRFISPITVQSTYSKFYPEDRLTLELKKLVDSATFKEWKHIRNVIIHRGKPGRIIYASNRSENSEPAEWKVGLRLDSNTTVTRLTWLRDSLNSLLSSLKAFIETRFEEPIEEQK